MKSTAIILLLIFCLSCKQEKSSVTDDAKLGYIIRGSQIQGTAFVYLQRYSENNQLITFDSVEIKDNSFEFTGHVNNLEPVEIIVGENTYPIILENTTYRLENNEVIGTKLQDDYNRYHRGLRNSKNVFVYQRNFIQSNPESILSAIVLKTMLGKTQWRLNQNKLAYDMLDESIKSSYLGKEINQFIKSEMALQKENTETIDITIPKEDVIVSSKKLNKKKKVKSSTNPLTKNKYQGVNFEADDIKGRNFELASVAQNSEYILIDFWASWCGPCRDQNAYLVEVYDLYHDKGFDIVSVSEDRSKLAWKNAVEADGLIWHNVIDDFNRLTNLYGVKTIPYTLLINGRGEIIASDISADNLKSRLNELLKK